MQHPCWPMLKTEAVKASLLATYTARATRGVEFFGWGDAIEEKGFSTLEVQHEDSGQWLTFERCEQGGKSTVSVHAVKALGVRGMAPGSLVVLRVRTDPAQKQQLVSFEVVEADVPSIVWAGPADWASLPEHRPTGPELGSFDGSIDPVGISSDQWEDQWWHTQLDRAM